MSNEKIKKSKVRIRFSRKLVLLCSLFIVHCSFVIAQDGETHFIQRLTWTGDEYARRYEVIIEKEEEGEYRELFQEFTNALFIEVPLLPGKYRCRVITHDYLNRPGPVPEWKYIEVLAVLDPETVNGTDAIELIHTTDSAEPKQHKQNHLADKVDIFLSAAWTPSFTISDEGNHFFKRDMTLSGATVRFGAVLTSNYFSINPGLELPVSYHFFHTGSGEPAHLLAFGLNLSALKRLPGDRTALTFRLGAGYGHLFTEPAAEAGGRGSPPDDASIAASFSGTQSIHINAGVSFLLFVMKHLYLETGLDYSHWFTSPTSYYFKPWLGIGFSK
jgi:hypothetical protein